MRITMAQVNPIVGDIDGNLRRILDAVEQAADEHADLVVLPELVVTGYPPKDLLERPTFVRDASAALEEVCGASAKYPQLGIVLGCPVDTGLEEGKALYNAALLIVAGKEIARQPKILLPTYDVFDEARYFLPGTDNAAHTFNDVRLGLSICEDLWFEPDPWNQRPYACDPIEMLAAKKAQLIINVSASPFSVGKERVRYELIRSHTTRHRVGFVLVNQVGGNDDLVFDGRSLFVDETGAARAVFPSFEECVSTIDTDADGLADPYDFEDETETILKALILGTRDYFRKCGLRQAIIGLSGGIDSAVTAVLAERALGAENVLVMAMPSPYSSTASLEDARQLAANLGVEMRVLEIEGIMSAYDATLAGEFTGCRRDVTEENIQARIRGNLLMAMSNKFGYLPLSTGNKSELAVGYCTLYGDMSGGLAVLSDVPKTIVYKLARRINLRQTVIPQRVIDKEPSAELRPDQRDTDSLPPYELLDQILECYIDQRLSLAQIVERGFDRDTVVAVVGLVRQNEYKRKQAAPGIKVTSKAFGSGRRMPVAARYDV